MERITNLEVKSKQIATGDGVFGPVLSLAEDYSVVTGTEGHWVGGTHPQNVATEPKLTTVIAGRQ